jgi:hypothetical protein
MRLLRSASRLYYVYLCSDLIAWAEPCFCYKSTAVTKERESLSIFILRWVHGLQRLVGVIVHKGFRRLHGMLLEGVPDPIVFTARRKVISLAEFLFAVDDS